MGLCDLRMEWSPGTLPDSIQHVKFVEFRLGNKPARMRGNSQERGSGIAIRYTGAMPDRFGCLPRIVIRSVSFTSRQRIQ